MKARPFSSMLVSMLFYTSLLSAMFVMPLILAGRNDAGVPVETGDAPVWTRSLETQSMNEPGPAGRLPQSDGSRSGPPAIEAPVDTWGPDITMIRPVKKRAKTIKL